MREAWYQDGSTARTADAAAPAGPSWTAGRLLAVALTVALAALTIGVGLGHLFTGGGAAAVADAPGAGLGAGSAEPPAPAEPPPATEIGDATAVERNGELLPAPAEHLLVAEISVSTCGNRERATGFLVADGLLATAAHAVGDAGLVRVDHRGTTVTGEVLGVLADGRDVALVAVDAPLAAPVPAAAAPAIGDAATLVGFPAGGPRTSVVGPVVEIAPAVAAAAGGGPIVGVDAPARLGMSGGPAIDEAGRVVGMVVASETATDTALVVGLGELAALGDELLVPGTCRGSA